MSDSLIADTLKEKMQLCGDRQFTGLFEVTTRDVENKENGWLFCFVKGRLVWSKSRTHALRRWERQLSVQSPTFYKHITQPARLSYKSWSHAILLDLVKIGRFSAESFSNMVEGTIVEDLFDIVQFGTQCYQRSGLLPAYRQIPKKINYLPKDLLYHDCAWQKARQAWDDWEQADLADISPDWVPVVSQVEALSARTSPQTFQTLTKFMNGRNTLRDLAFVFKRPLIDLTKAVLPYVSKQLLTFAVLPDLIEDFEPVFYPDLFVKELTILPPLESLPVQTMPSNRFIAPTIKAATQPSMPNQTAGKVRDRNQRTIESTVPKSSAPKSSAPKIAYIDDSSIDERQMSAAVKGLGYQFTSISNPIHALPILLETKPDFIFLDLVMPIANGYEVCSQIRRISMFKATPIVIVTINDGIGDRVRARFVGASGFIGKPITRKKVSKMLKKFLRDANDSSVERETRHSKSQRHKGILSSP